jgi:ribonuclease HII
MKFQYSNYKSIIKGDTLSLSIAAASIIAKVHRDRLMQQLSLIHPEYLWYKNSGYGTSEHIEALKKFGPTAYHRTKFIRNIIPNSR